MNGAREAGDSYRTATVGSGIWIQFRNNVPTDLTPYPVTLDPVSCALVPLATARGSVTVGLMPRRHQHTFTARLEAAELVAEERRDWILSAPAIIFPQ